MSLYLQILLLIAVSVCLYLLVTTVAKSKHCNLYLLLIYLFALGGCVYMLVFNDMSYDDSSRNIGLALILFILSSSGLVDMAFRHAKERQKTADKDNAEKCAV